METPELNGSQELIQKLNRETAKIPWKELQRFFASGNAIFVEETLDLIQVAAKFANDDAQEIEHLMQQNRVKPVDDGIAAAWLKNDLTVWAVVVSPWVLVQLVSR